MEYAFIIIVVAVFAAAFIIQWKRQKEAEKGNSLQSSSQEKEKIVSDALRMLNCEGTWNTQKEGRSILYDYQNGHFRIRITDNKPYVELGYFYCFSTEMENLQTVRHLCNMCNMSTETSLVFYTIDDEKNRINVHITANLLLDHKRAKAILTRAMADMFHWQTAFTQGFDNRIEASKKAEMRDLEADRSQWQRIIFLLREQEMQCQHVSPKERLGIGTPLTLGEVVLTMFAISNIKPKRLIVSNNTVSEITDESDITQYNIADAIIADGEFKHQEAMLSLEFLDLRHTSSTRHIVIHLKEEKGTEHTLYFRLTATLLPLNISRDIQPASSENSAHSVSMIAAYDMTSTEQRRNEYLYMKKEAEAMHQRGEDDQMTDEQKLLIDCANDDLGYHLYHGKRLFLAKRFLEAEPHLRNAFDMLMPSFPGLRASLQEAFYDSCYMLGFCYNEMQQYQHAFYYLEMVFPLRRITYTEEYINCLVNQHDFRVMQVIDSVQEMVERILHPDENSDEEDSEEKPDSNAAIMSFNSFLKRRKSYVLIETGRYDEARAILNELLNDPDSSDFAMSELAYLQKITEK